jgi:hypothetical protein
MASTKRKAAARARMRKTIAKFHALAKARAERIARNTKARDNSRRAPARIRQEQNPPPFAEPGFGRCNLAPA